MSTFLEMQVNVSTELYDPDHYFWTLANVKQAINDANVDFCDRTKILRGSDAVTMVEDQADYDVPSGCGIIMDASFGTDNIPVAIIGEGEMKMYFGSYWRNATGNTPKAITQTFTGPGSFTVYPYPDSDAAGSDITLRFQKRPPDTLTEDTDEPEFIVDFHRALEVYALSLLIKRDIEHQNLPKATMYMNEYLLDWVPRAKTFVLRQFKAGGRYVPPPDVFF